MVTLIGYGLALVLGFIAYLVSRSRIAWRQRYERTAAALAQQAARLLEMQEDQIALQNELAKIRTGTPRERLDASLDGLRDIAGRTARPAAPRVARPPAAAGNDQP